VEDVGNSAREFDIFVEGLRQRVMYVLFMGAHMPRKVEWPHKKLSLPQATFLGTTQGFINDAVSQVGLPFVSHK
jgi:hypothetical protein